jgi:hypothetical protein
MAYAFGNLGGLTFTRMEIPYSYSTSLVGDVVVP